jgi:cell wall assembly regulator SMI1
MNEPFADFDLSDFWEDSDYARQEYVGPSFTDLDVARVEKELGYKLPKSYITLMRTQNGGIPKRTNHKTNERTSWAEDHIAENFKLVVASM